MTQPQQLEPRLVLPSWAIHVEAYGCDWASVPRWDGALERWEVQLVCEGAPVGTYALDTPSWRTGWFQLVDPDGALEEMLRAKLEGALDQGFLAAFGRQKETQPAIVEALLSRRAFGLVYRLLREVDSQAQRAEWYGEAMGLVAYGLGDKDGFEKARRRLRQHGHEATGLKARCAALVPLNAEELETQKPLLYPGRADVEAAIDEAFKDARMPQTEAELTSGGIAEPCVVRHFFGLGRGDVEAMLAPLVMMEDFTDMTPGAVNFYLPSVLLCMLKPPYDDELWDCLHGFLKPTSCVNNTAHFNASQCAAIALWSRFLAAEWRARKLSLYGDIGQSEIEEAMKLAESYQGVFPLLRKKSAK